MTVWRLRVACSITKATNTHSEYVIITAFSWQQWLREHVSMLRFTCTHMACLVYGDHELCSLCGRKHIFNGSGIVMSPSVLMQVNFT